VTDAGPRHSLPLRFSTFRPILFHSLRNSLLCRRRHPSRAGLHFLDGRAAFFPRGQFWERSLDRADFSAEAFERVLGARAGELTQLLESQTPISAFVPSDFSSRFGKSAYSLYQMAPAVRKLPVRGDAHAVPLAQHRRPNPLGPQFRRRG
jgi:hypothetical protein